ncbi:F0F1 ATP synthase subunit I [Acinetobacter junii]|jgi:ATP synthase protein I|uniref:ATP synthase subunit I n=2 Tax=Acinetobacter junii TaxID=40215 RepID=A0A2R4UT48_ACIJU|nr:MULTISPECIES: ATP synthase subunit I [Acinetobacter]MBY3626228.1 F0F1 ATP synthase subunit I [Acinetobacter sp. CUI P1]APU47120.1 F0F1 ATP synthase subunit I [Acinetobacter junii]ATU46656.1 F0F1 ATP synthase subunit I [Acinetobacter junii]AWA49221.1 F0F1 ATP synthase subunit I [Acinetobacter junii]EEY91531.1 ATP synthase F0, I subunit [Acinetobacter junii SH205]
MSRTSRMIDRRLAKALVFLQACMIPVAALLAWLIKDTTAALSAALGALVCWLAHCYFAWQSFRTAGARASKQVMLNMYRGMLGKFAIVIVGFILILSNVKPLSPVALFSGFILVQAMSWVAPFWASRLQKRG